MATLTNLSKLWYERLYDRVGLPFWAGVLLVGFLPALFATLLGFFAYSVKTDFTGDIALGVPLLLVNIIYLQYSSRYNCRSVQKLEGYAVSMGADEARVQTRFLSGFQFVLATWIVLLLSGVFVLEPMFSPGYTVFQNLLRELLYAYTRLLQATSLWVFLASMIAIYKIGRLPMRLKIFTNDRTMGLKPFANTSLRIITIYVLAVLLTFPIYLYANFAVELSLTIFLIPGIFFFLVPLFGLHKKMREAREEKSAVIGLRHSRVMNEVETAGDGPLSEALVNELLAIDAIKREIHQTHEWPFDIGTVARLSGVLGAPLIAAVLAAYVIRIFGL
ncbi:MAG TPA: hypothetical protein VFE96_02895 [Candidatus Bathyarchaeia archaeon]|nr:hypothetical protein [Candidatus Bathyarchaeia archaeon]